MGDSRDPSRIRVPFSGQKIQIPGTDIELPMGLDLSRRDVLKIAGYGSLAAFIAACGGTGTTTTTTSVTAKGGSMSLGSYLSDAVPKKGLQDVVDAFTSANGGTKVKVNTVDHGTFQNQITSYLQAGRRLHVVLRTSHAVFCQEGTGAADRRCLERCEEQLH